MDEPGDDEVTVQVVFVEEGEGSEDEEDEGGQDDDELERRWIFTKEDVVFGYWAKCPLG